MSWPAQDTRCWATGQTITYPAHRRIAHNLRHVYNQRATWSHDDGTVVALRALFGVDLHTPQARRAIS